MSNPQQRFIEFDKFRLDLEERTLSRDGQRVVLAQKSYELLLRLVERSGKLVRHDELMRSVWHETAVDQSSLKQNIALIRKALGDNSEEPQYIQTVPKYGYRFIAPVSVLPDENVALVAERHSVMEISVEEELAERRALPPARFGTVRRRFAWTALAAIIVVLCIPVAVYLRRRAVEGPAVPSFAVGNITPRKLTDSGNIEGGVLSPNGEFTVYNTVADGGTSELWLRQIDSREAIRIVSLSMPEAVGAYTVTNDGKWVYYVVTRGGEWGAKASLFRASILGGKPQKITDHIDGYVSFSPDDRRIVFNRFKPDGCELVTANAVDGAGEVVIAKGKTNAEYLEPKWSPDGTRILFFSYERRGDGYYWTLATLPKDGGPISIIIEPRRQRIWFLAWTRPGEIALTATDPLTRLPQIYSIQETGGELTRVTNDLFYYSGVSVGGNSILATKIERPSAIWVSGAENGFTDPVKLTNDSFSEGIDWTPDGRIVYDTLDLGKLHLWSVSRDGNSKEQISPERFDEMLADVSADGSRLAYLSTRGGRWEIWTSRSDGSEARQLTTKNLPLWWPKIAPDGLSVYYDVTENGVSHIENATIADGSTRRVISDTPVQIYDLSPDGRHIAYSFTDNASNAVKVALFSLDANQITRIFEIAPTKFLRFTGDGTALIFKNSDMSKAPASSVWIQPLDGSTARQLVDFKSDDVYNADLSADGTQLATIRGRRTSDLILLTARRK